MTLWKLVRNSLRFYWRTHIGVALGVAISTAVIVGALVVGESVRYSLKAISLSKLGKVDYAMASQDRFFRAKLADDLEKELGTAVVPALMLNGIAINSDNNLRANQVQIFGIDDRFWELRNEYKANIKTDGDFLIINERLSRHLKSKVGDELLIRMEKTSLLPRDAPMSTDTDLSVSMRLGVNTVTPNLHLGDFSLQSSQVPPFNVFVPLSMLQEKIDLMDRANLMLVGNTGELLNPPSPLFQRGNAGIDLQRENVDALNVILRENWQIGDADLVIQETQQNDTIQLSTGRIFLDHPIVDVVKKIPSENTKILTYLVNEIRLNERTTPYSMVSAIDPIGNIADIKDDEIIINSWLADDLKAKLGDTVNLTYFIFGENRKLTEQTTDFCIKAIVPMEGLANDRTLMPDFPGVAEVENSRDWEPGIPIDLKKIRDKDEDYWHKHRGTPKAFITLKAGQSLWANRYGDLTAIRFPSSEEEKVKSAIIKNLNPSSVGLFFVPIRERILSASNPTTDFGQLFLGLSFFLIVSAILLTGLLFVFGTQQRREEIGTLLALGLTKRMIRKAFVLEGFIVALIGGALGTIGGILYTKVVLYALSTVWIDVVGATNLQYHSSAIKLISGAFAGIEISMLTIWLTLRRQTKVSARELLSTAGEFEGSIKGKFSKWGLLVAIGSAVIAIILIIWAGSGKGSKAVGAFFGAGGLLLIGSFSISHYLLSSFVRAKEAGNLTMAKLGFRNTVRRRGRSLAIIILLACGSFMIIAIGSNRLDSMRNMEERSSGTGGFALYAETTLPILRDLNDKSERELVGLDSPDTLGVRFVQLRVHEGDDASCLNLNRVQNPRLLGVNPDELQKRGSFTFGKALSDNGFGMLKDESQEGGIRTINAIGDDAMITWSLGLSVGDTVRYLDERGNPFDVRIAGAISNTIMQGSLIISEKSFKELYPSESGSRVFLIDAPFESMNEASKRLSRIFQNYGMEVTPTYQRLAEFNAVQNTYLSIFQMLGGLALIIGSLGLGIIVMRNVMERRNELALLRAVGFKRNAIQWFLLSEHWLLLIMGLVFGAIAGFVAVVPSLTSPGAEIPYFSLSITLILVALSGFLWTWLAVKLAIRGNLISALRNE